MDIRKLTGDGFVDRKKIDRYSQTTSGSGSTSESKDSSEAGLGSDRITLSSVSVSSDVAFASSVFKNLNQSSLERVRSIKQAIEKGEYDVEKALSKITSKILSDVRSTDIMLASGAAESSKSVENYGLVRLTEESLAVISKKLLRDLSNL